MSISSKLSLTALLITVFLGCNDFMTKEIELGVAEESRITGDDTDDAGDDTDGDTDTAPADDDADGVSNEVEETFNMKSGTADSDQDGYSDGLEFVGNGGDPLNGSIFPSPTVRSRILTINESGYSGVDSDLDGLSDRFEEEKSLSSNNPDTDGDGYDDGLELVALSDPFDASDRPKRVTPPTSDGINRLGSGPRDADGDGLSDILESLNGTTATQRDSDRDGFSDGLEYLMGSDPLDDQSIPNFNVPLPPSRSE